MKNKKLFVAISVALFIVAVSPVFAANKKARLIKVVISEVNGFTIAATKNSNTYIINAERAVLQNAKGKRATIDQFFTGDQINVKGNYDSDGNIVARTIKDQSLKGTDLTRRNVGSDNLKDDAISDLNFISNGVITEDKLQSGTITNFSISDSADIGYSKLNLSNAITGNDLASNISINTTGNISGNNFTASGVVTSNGTGNNYFAGNVGIGTATPGYKLDVNGNATFGQGKDYGASSFSLVTIGGGDVSNYDIIFSGAGNNAYGLINEPAFHATGNAEGVQLEYKWYTVTVDNGVTLNNAYGIYLDNPNKTGTGTITKAYGLYVKNPTLATTNVTAYFEGNIGIGTTSPQSKLHVDGGYIQLDNNSGAPTSGDCDAAAEEGRIYWDATGDELYVCSGASGWRKVTTVAP